MLSKQRLLLVAAAVAFSSGAPVTGQDATLSVSSESGCVTGSVAYVCSTELSVNVQGGTLYLSPAVADEDLPPAFQQHGVTCHGRSSLSVVGDSASFTTTEGSTVTLSAHGNLIEYEMTCLDCTNIPVLDPPGTCTIMYEVTSGTLFGVSASYAVWIWLLVALGVALVLAAVCSRFGQPDRSSGSSGGSASTAEPLLAESIQNQQHLHQHQTVSPPSMRVSLDTGFMATGVTQQNPQQRQQYHQHQQQQSLEQRRQRLEDQRRSADLCADVDGQVRAWLGFTALGVFAAPILWGCVFLLFGLLVCTQHGNEPEPDVCYGDEFLGWMTLAVFALCGCAPSVWVCYSRYSSRDSSEDEQTHMGSFARIVRDGELMITAPLAGECCTGEGSCYQMISDRRAGREDSAKFFARRNNNCFWCSWFWLSVVALFSAGLTFVIVVMRVSLDTGFTLISTIPPLVLLAYMPTCCLWIGRGPGSGECQCLKTDYDEVMTPLTTEAAVTPANAAEGSPQPQPQPQQQPQLTSESQLAGISGPASPASATSAAVPIQPVTSQLSLAEFYTAHNLESFASALDELGVLGAQPARRARCTNAFNFPFNLASLVKDCPRITRLALSITLSA